MTEGTPRRSLGQILIGIGVIGEEQLEAALLAQKQSGLRLGEQLETLGYCTVEDVEWALSSQYDLPLVRVKADQVDAAAAALIPAGLARAGTLIATWAVGDDLGVVMADPTNRQIVEAVVQATGKQVQFSLGIPSEIRRAQDHVYGPQEEGELTTAFGLYDGALFDMETRRVVDLDPTGKAFLEAVFDEAGRQGARAVYFEPRARRFVVRFRERGGVRDVVHCHRDWYRQVIDKLGFLANVRPVRDIASMRMGRYRVRDDGGERFGYEVTVIDGPVAPAATCVPFVRLSASPDLQHIDFGSGVGNVARVLQDDAMPIVVAVPASGGAGWLLRALFAALNEDYRRAAALGVPGEIAQERADDRAYTLVDAADVEASDVAARVAALRRIGADLMLVMNPDGGNPVPALNDARWRGERLIVTAPGEGADAALARLEQGDAAGMAALDRLAVFAGRAVPRLCASCKTAIDLSDAARAALGLSGAGPVFRASGCADCAHTGFSGTAFLGEVAVVDPAGRTLVGADAATARLERLLAAGDVALYDYMRLRGRS